MNITSFPKAIQPLDVLEIPSSEKQYIEIQKQVDLWSFLAQQKKAKTPIPVEKELFETLSSIAIVLSISLENRSPSHQLLACTDKKKNIQSIALVSNEVNRIFLKYLITNPKNIRSDVNSNELNRVRGAGTAIIHHLLEKCLTEQKTLQLYSTPSSEPFYKKLYFEKVNSSSSSTLLFSTRKIKFLFSNKPISQPIQSSNLQSLNWLDLATPTTLQTTKFLSSKRS
ncbi:MAG: hypothetical protein JSS09_02680 [Verrucomicrobia bacterium]|nr:hypothetical protein [Verrucomicrobiota bacterium]